LLNVDDIGRLG